MNVRKTLVALSIAAVAAPAAFATNFIGGELGYESHPLNSANSATTRAQVQKDFEAFRAHPVLSDGTVFIQGELGYVSANQGSSVDRDPVGPHTHVLGSNAGQMTLTAPAPMTDAQRRAYREQYAN